MVYIRNNLHREITPSITIPAFKTQAVGGLNAQYHLGRLT